MINPSEESQSSNSSSEPTHWVQLIYRWGRYLAPAALAVLSVVVFLAIYGVNIKIGPVQIIRSNQEPNNPQKAELIASDIATFGNKWPRTNVGTDWSIFSDNKFLGRSVVWYETVKHLKADDYFLRIHFSLDRGPHALIPDAYCGVYMEWSEPPPRIVNASNYSGLSFRADYSLKGGGSGKPRFLISVATLGTKNYEYHELDFTRQILPSAVEFKRVYIPFSALDTPDWASDGDREFNSSQVFRISIAVKGIDVGGHLDIDDLIFVKK